MAKRVAITIAGAVSLGSYEAGVVYELLEAFRTYNLETAGPDAKIYVDVLTGASAGGMTAAMLAQRLMFDGDAMQGELTNTLYQAWVEGISIQRLVRLTVREKRYLRWHSLLSSDLIEKIAREMLEDSMAPGKPRSGPHPAVELDEDGNAEPMDVGLALTNLNGIDYMLPVVGIKEDGFNYTASADQKIFTVHAGEESDTAKWKDLSQAAVACGAFPAAFRPQAIVRASSEYGLPKRPPAGGPAMEEGKTYLDWGENEPDPRPFAYCDGGVLQNQPLGIAKNFVDKRKQQAAGEQARELADDRLYVFVSPHAVKSSAENNLVAEEITIAQELVALFHTYIRQATYHDWITAEGMNQKVHILDRNATNLAAALRNGEVQDVASLLKAAAELNALLVPDSLARDKAAARLKVEYSEEYTSVAGASTPQSELAANAFLQAIATLESAAQLNDRDTMKIVAVIADGRTELAGSGISAFAGFFSKEFREHDYWMGRVKTRVYLQRKDVKKILNVTEWPREKSWGGTEQKDVVKVLLNPTNISSLPLSFAQMMKPGLGSLFYMLLIRRKAFFWTAAILSAMVAIPIGLVLCLLRHMHR